MLDTLGCGARCTLVHMLRVPWSLISEVVGEPLPMLRRAASPYAGAASAAISPCPVDGPQGHSSTHSYL
jgi:hypothetical protein